MDEIIQTEKGPTHEQLVDYLALRFLTRALEKGNTFAQRSPDEFMENIRRSFLHSSPENLGAALDAAAPTSPRPPKLVRIRDDERTVQKFRPQKQY